MQVADTDLAGVKLITPKKFGDHRGFFSETYNVEAFAAAGIDAVFVQDNHSLSRDAGTVRGLHFQIAPFAQAKLVRVIRGAIIDVAVDLRRGSSTFGRHIAAELSAANGTQIYIPVGFAHGLCTIEPDTEVLYKVSSVYSPAHERGLRWNDPALGIGWPVAENAAILSGKDAEAPDLAALQDFF